MATELAFASPEADDGLSLIDRLEAQNDRRVLRAVQKVVRAAGSYAGELLPCRAGGSMRLGTQMDIGRGDRGQPTHRLVTFHYPPGPSTAGRLTILLNEARSANLQLVIHDPKGRFSSSDQGRIPEGIVYMGTRAQGVLVLLGLQTARQALSDLNRTLRTRGALTYGSIAAMAAGAVATAALAPPVVAAAAIITGVAVSALASERFFIRAHVSAIKERGQFSDLVPTGPALLNEALDRLQIETQRLQDPAALRVVSWLATGHTPPTLAADADPLIPIIRSQLSVPERVALAETCARFTASAPLNRVNGHNGTFSGILDRLMSTLPPAAQADVLETLISRLDEHHVATRGEKWFAAFQDTAARVGALSGSVGRTLADGYLFSENAAAEFVHVGRQLFQQSGGALPDPILVPMAQTLLRLGMKPPGIATLFTEHGFNAIDTSECIRDAQRSLKDQTRQARQTQTAASPRRASRP